MKPHFETVRGSIQQVLEFNSANALSESTRLEADLGMDSGLMLELIMELEDNIPELEVDQATLDYENFRTIGAICDYIDGRLLANAAA